MTRLRFTKMHGLGNDFMVIDAIRQRVDLSTQKIRALANRHFGVGFDQLLLVEKPQRPGQDFRYRIFNADGGEVEQCGNGARCFARFVRDQGLSDKNELHVETNTGDIILKLRADGLVTVDMGVPRLVPGEIPFEAPRQALRYDLDVDGQRLSIGAVSMGNPHAVLRVDDIANAFVGELGPLIESHPRFPRRVNVGFLQIVDRGHGILRVYERGVGETLACGTGACAAMVVGRLWGEFDATVRMLLQGGELEITWPGEGHPVLMTGPAATVFEGEITV